MVTIDGEEVVAFGSLYLTDGKEIRIDEGGVELTIRFNQDSPYSPAGWRQGKGGQHLLELPQCRIESHNPYSAQFGQESLRFLISVNWLNDLHRVLTYTIVRDPSIPGTASVV